MKIQIFESTFNDIFIAGTISGEIKVWDLANCNELQTIESFSTPILWMAVFNLDKLVVQARFDFQVKVFIFKVIYGYILNFSCFKPKLLLSIVILKLGLLIKG